MAIAATAIGNKVIDIFNYNIYNHPSILSLPGV